MIGRFVLVVLLELRRRWLICSVRRAVPLLGFRNQDGTAIVLQGSGRGVWLMGAVSFNSHDSQLWLLCLITATSQLPS